ncbi:MAG: hypothetical protein ACLPX9_18085 [Rhodomicrobium sp.]
MKRHVPTQSQEPPAALFFADLELDRDFSQEIAAAPQAFLRAAAESADALCSQHPRPQFSAACTEIAAHGKQFLQRVAEYCRGWQNPADADRARSFFEFPWLATKIVQCSKLFL